MATGNRSLRQVCENCVASHRPLRGHARSHRYCTVLEACAVGPVGAGVPAKGPEQATSVTGQIRPVISHQKHPLCLLPSTIGIRHQSYQQVRRCLLLQHMQPRRKLLRLPALT